MTIRLPESRLSLVGPGMWLDYVTGSGVAVRKYDCIYPALRVNNPSTPPVRQTHFECWVNRCTDNNRQVQIARVSVKMTGLTTVFPPAPVLLYPDAIVDPDQTYIAVGGDMKGLVTKAYDIITNGGYDPSNGC